MKIEGTAEEIAKIMHPVIVVGGNDREAHDPDLEIMQDQLDDIIGDINALDGKMEKMEYRIIEKVLKTLGKKEGKGNEK